jgi:hypothetical protein
VDIATAALWLGLSVDTVRKRVQRGMLPAEKVDGRWFVVLDRVLDHAQDVQDSHPDGPEGYDKSYDNVRGPEGLGELVALVERQQQTIMELSGRCGWLQSELQQTRTRLEVAEETIRLLQAPAARSESNLPPDPVPALTPIYPAPSANGHDSGAERPAGAERPWWAFWRWLEV